MTRFVRKVFASMTGTTFSTIVTCLHRFSHKSIRSFLNLALVFYVEEMSGKCKSVKRLVEVFHPKAVAEFQSLPPSLWARRAAQVRALSKSGTSQILPKANHNEPNLHVIYQRRECLLNTIMKTLRLACM